MKFFLHLYYLKVTNYFKNDSSQFIGRGRTAFLLKCSRPVRFERSKPKEYKVNLDLLRGEQEQEEIRNLHEPHRSNETNEEAEMKVDDRFRAERNQSEESRQRDSNAESPSWR